MTELCLILPEGLIELNVSFSVVLHNVALCSLPICCKSIEKWFPWWLFTFCDDCSFLACRLQIFLCWNIFTLHYFWFTLQGCTRYQSHFQLKTHLTINWLSTNQIKALQGNTRHYCTFQLMNCIADLRYYGTDCIQISHCERLIRTNEKQLK